MPTRESMEFDVVIIGAGPAGLAAAIHLAQLSQAKQQNLSICVLEKGASVGSHILSGAVMDPCALNELIPDWAAKNAPLTTPVTHDEFHLLTTQKAYRLPTPAVMKNHGNFIISLGQLCQWLATQAEQLGVNIFPGFAASDILFNDANQVIGMQTTDMGLDKNRQPTARFQAGINLYAKHTLFAEGCRGSLSEKIIQHFDLRQHADPQTYAIGLKELWRIPKQQHQPGKVIHTVGWPLDQRTYGGSFIYHLHDQQIALGLVVGLDYQNPYLDPFQELQRLKTHPLIRRLLTDGECLNYGARALNEGGLQAIPKLQFPGGMLIGCSAGFLNVGRIKGIHNAIRSGMLAAKAIVQQTDYAKSLRQSPIYKELYKVRNLRAYFHKGLWAGLIGAGIDQWLLRGRAPWTLHYQPDHQSLQLAKNSRIINYPKPDGKLTFDRLTQVYLAGVKHQEQQPCHLVLKDPNIPIKINLPQYAAPEQRYCPANVYEIIETNGKPQLQINAANCIQCKTCDIKDPEQNIVWTVPEGGDGPNYDNM